MSKTEDVKIVGLSEREHLDFMPLTPWEKLPEIYSDVPLSGGRDMPEHIKGIWTFYGLNGDGSFKLQRDKKV